MPPDATYHGLYSKKVETVLKGRIIIPLSFRQVFKWYDKFISNCTKKITNFFFLYGYIEYFLLTYRDLNGAQLFIWYK